MKVNQTIGGWCCVLFVLGGWTSAAWADKVVLVAGGGTKGDGEPATEATVSGPFGVAFDKAGNMYIAEYTGHRVRKVDAKGVITTVAGTGEAGFAGDGGPGDKAKFNAMHDLIVADNGDIYIADTNNRRVRKIDAKTGRVNTFAGNGEKQVTGDGGAAEKASFDGVVSIFFGPKEEKLYVTGFSKVVRVIDMKTGTIDTVKDLPGGRSVAVDSRGNVYVAGGQTLRVRHPDGTVETLLDAKNTGGSDQALAGNPKHLGIDAKDNVLIADEGHHQIRKYIPGEKKLVVVAGTGKKGTAGLDGPSEKVELSGPHGVYFHPNGTIYIADSFNNRVLKIVP